MPKLAILSCLLLATAVSCQLKWLGCCSRSAALVASAATLSDDQRTAAVDEAKQLISSNRYYPGGGFIAAVVGLALGVASAGRNERGAFVPIVLFIPYLLLLLVLV